jgi:AcrR family transcriptional regulator
VSEHHGVKGTSVARRGRRPGPTQTRDDLLIAARAQFAEHGYRGTTVRAVAREAGVHAALIHHHFGTKEQLYAAAFGGPVDHFETLVHSLADAPRGDAAEVLVRHFVSTWRNEETGPALRALARGWFGDPAGTALLRAHVDSVVIPALAAALHVSKINTAAAYAHLLGLVIADTFMGVDRIRTASEDEIVALVAPAIRHYTDPPVAAPRPPPNDRSARV